MSALWPSAAPSKALLRYLRTQTDGAGRVRCAWSTPPSHIQGQRHDRQQSCSFQRQQSRSFQRQQSRSFHRQQSRSFYSTTPCRYGSPRSYIDDLFARNREKCKALPAPKPHPLQTIRSDRHSSSDTSPNQPSFWQRIWYRRKSRKPHQRGYDYANPDSFQDYPASSSAGSYEESSAQMFNLSRALSRSPSGTELKLRCTEFDANGSVTLVSGEFKKSELIAKYGLLPRDLRKIDSSVLPHILVRPSAILLNLLHLRVLIQSDRVLVFDAYGSTDSYTQSLFMYDLEGKLRQKPNKADGGSYLPYEFRALEAVLISVTSGLEAEFALVRDPVTHILRALEEDIDREKLRHLLIHSKKLGTFEQKARLVRDALDELLEAEDDLAQMYLTETKLAREKQKKLAAATKDKTSDKSAGSEQNCGHQVMGRNESDHQEVEMLLESYHKICDEVVEISNTLISNIRNTEEVIKAILDANRNQLMLFEIKVSVATLGLAGGTLIAGLYGMNLENFIEDSNWGFGMVTAVTAILSAWICVVGLRKLRRVQKVRMWGEGYSAGYDYGHGHGARDWHTKDFALKSARSRGNWRAEALEVQAQKERERRFRGATAGAGPVLWPGMDGLGLHKLNANANSDGSSSTASTSSAANEGFEPTNSDADDTGGRKPPVVRIKDDTSETSFWDRMRKEKVHGKE